MYDPLIYQEVHYENDLVVHHHHWENERSSGDREKQKRVRRGISSIANESLGSDEKIA